MAQSIISSINGKKSLTAEVNHDAIGTVLL